MRRALAQALLPAAILPVLVLGPGLMHAPERLWRQVSAEVQRLTRGGGGGASHHRHGTAAHGAHAPAVAVGADGGAPAR